MCLCVDVFVYLWKAINVDLCIYGIVVLWICVNPLSSLSVPFVIHSYVHMILFTRSLRADGQDAVLSLRSCPRHRAMRYKRVIAVQKTIHAHDALLALPTAIQHISILQHLRSLQSRRQTITRDSNQRRWGRAVTLHHVLHKILVITTA